MIFKVGFSKDRHNLITGNFILLGGIKIPSNSKVEAYSNGDVLFHSLAEAIFGSLGEEDLGQNYNSKNMSKNFESIIMVQDAMKILEEREYQISNVDILIELDSPNLTTFKSSIKKNLSQILKINLDQISIKATTTEGNFKNIITSYCNILIYKSEEKNNEKN
ncbi:2-C-methyl-D-erythritol 2,4-cyclodiphosphate synthase [Spiroplasma cantharicola]|uniref:2-C-methyl-D-erythritol 2,4-cyclodiphosphate synthase n=1 Tax=Spiroplasma cantharicola TaxID=362837 RepID=A0A0M5KCL4_9MOLU|nr:2-C-methyl-D-erythritol 2,4-cyclodiphosphate synthase [Spiroplasma cantharicola]ALD66893.1 2-C-methyl-D-erythritol 2,4-cyclodiphosphate synthase [Spiroplasma cantharicola]